MTNANTIAQPISSKRIVIIGNQGSYGYRLASWLRTLGCEVELILLSGKDTTERDRPESVDRSLRDGKYPGWIHTYTKWDDRLRSVDASYDVALTLGPSGLATITSLPTHFPVVHFVMGTDLSIRPVQYKPSESFFGSWYEKFRYHRYFAPNDVRIKRMQTLHARKSYDRSNAIISTFAPEILAAHEIGVSDKLRLWPFPEDVLGNRQRVDQALSEELHAAYRDQERLFLWLSRLNFVGDGPENKGADCFLRAFARMSHESEKPIKAIVGAHGMDVKAFQSLAKELQVDSQIDYVSHLPLWKLLTYLSLPKAIVCDGITTTRNTVSGMVREAISLGTPVVTHVNQSLMEICYRARLPIDFADNVESCYTQMRRLVELSDQELISKRNEISDWATRYLDFRAVLPGLIHILEETAYVQGFAQTETLARIRARF